MHWMTVKCILFCSLFHRFIHCDSTERVHVCISIFLVALKAWICICLLLQRSVVFKVLSRTTVFSIESSLYNIKDSLMKTACWYNILISLLDYFFPKHNGVVSQTGFKFIQDYLVNTNIPYKKHYGCAYRDKTMALIYLNICEWVHAVFS